MTTEKQKPAHEIRLGSVKAAIWENRSDKSGTWHTVSFNKLYKTNDTWRRTSGFGQHDLPLVIRLAEDAAQWMKSNSTAPIPAAQPAS